MKRYISARWEFVLLTGVFNVWRFACFKKRSRKALLLKWKQNFELVDCILDGSEQFLMIGYKSGKKNLIYITQYPLQFILLEAVASDLIFFRR